MISEEEKIVNGGVKRSREHNCCDKGEVGTDPELDNVRIDRIKAVIYPQLLMEQNPTSAQAHDTVLQTRQAINEVLQGKDDRIVAIVGPCSIHDPTAALEYAERLQKLGEKLQQDLVLVMRVYFEKPRTSVGWKGLINDPNLDESYDVNLGLQICRRLLSQINSMKLAAATEFVDVLIPQYCADLISWGAIGARTTESQLHRQLASGLSMPIGFKNATSGDTQVAVDAIRSASFAHTFLSITKQGLPAIVISSGNDSCHVVLRGGASGTNYDTASVSKAVEICKAAKVPHKVVIDCSHGNSNKDHLNQIKVVQDICNQLQSGENAIAGVMIESHINEGRQSLPMGIEIDLLRDRGEKRQKLEQNAKEHGCPMVFQQQGQRQEVLSRLAYGVSITDACIGWEQTVQSLESLAAAVRARRSIAINIVQ